MIRASAPGKINILLSVGERDEDGYHDLVTVFHALALRDTVALTPALDPSRPRLSVAGPCASPGIPTDERNLARRAVTALAEVTGQHVPVDIAIDKNIPVAGGMGGGSADAAAALVAYATLIDVEDAQLLHQIASTLGADVPFALHGGTAVGTGRGDELATVMTGQPLHWVLAVSNSELSTPTVYQRLDEMRDSGLAVPSNTDAGPTVAALMAGDPHALAQVMHNDLQAAACDVLPDITAVLHTGRDAGALAGLVSGSGPTVAFLVENPTHALDLAVMLEASTAVSHVVRTVGPSAGAHVLTDEAHT